MNLRSIIDKLVENGRLVLAQPTMLFTQKDQIKVEKVHVVAAHEVGRPDLISLDYYRSSAHVDYILKFNNISDPFSINEGDIIKIPVLGDFTKKLERPKGEVFNIVRQEFIGKRRVTKKDQRRSEFLKKKYKVKEVLPPNVLKTGHKTFEFTEKDGVKSTVLGMGPATPDKTYFKKKNKVKKKDGTSNTRPKKKHNKSSMTEEAASEETFNMTEKGMERKQSQMKTKKSEENRERNKENRKGNS